METRVHKLLILAGEEGVDLEARDFKKLSEVIVNEYLSQPNATFKVFLIDIMTKVVSRIPLKCHLYAGLTVAMAKGYSDLAGKILQSVVGTLHTCLTAGNFSETLNCLNYLSETMNVSFLNSLNYMNLLEDLLLAAETEHDAVLKKSLVSVLVRALPLCAYSLSQKTHHELKKFMEKLAKMVEDDELFAYLYNQFSQSRLPNYSAMDRLGFDFNGANQHNGKLRLLLDLKNARGKESTQIVDLYKWDVKSNDLQYQAYRKGEGLVVRMWLQQLIETFSGNSQMLQLKFTNLARTKTENINQLRFIVQTLILRGLRSKNGMIEISLLVSLRNTEQLSKFSPYVEELLFQFFNSAETFELSLLVGFAQLFAFVVNNSKQDINWEKYADTEDLFLKRAALLRLILEKMTLLNDKFKCLQSLSAFENGKPFTSQQEFTNSADQQIFDQFDKALKQKTEAQAIMETITNERQYEIFLESLFRRTSLSQTHLNILSERYSTILTKFAEWDWDLINKVRNFFRNSFFHRLLYLRFMITNKYLSFPSYINYVGGLKNKSEIDMIWIKMELNQLNNEFGKSLKSGK